MNIEEVAVNVPDPVAMMGDLIQDHEGLYYLMVDSRSFYSFSGNTLYNWYPRDPEDEPGSVKAGTTLELHRSRSVGGVASFSNIRVYVKRIVPSDMVTLRITRDASLDKGDKWKMSTKG